MTKLAHNIGNRYFAGMLFLVVIIMIVFPSDMKVLSYNTLYTLVQILLVCLALMYLAEDIAKIIARNRQVQKWYLSFEAKKWRNEK